MFIVWETKDPTITRHLEAIEEAIEIDRRDWQNDYDEGRSQLRRMKRQLEDEEEEMERERREVLRKWD